MIIKLILVIEADHDLRVEIRRVLEDSRYFVVSTTNGAEALALLSRIRLPVAILLSRNTSTLDSEEFIKFFKTKSEFSKIPVIQLKNEDEDPFQGNCCAVVRSDISRFLVAAIERCLGSFDVTSDENKRHA